MVEPWTKPGLKRAGIATGGLLNLYLSLAAYFSIDRTPWGFLWPWAFGTGGVLMILVALFPHAYKLYVWTGVVVTLSWMARSVALVHEAIVRGEMDRFWRAQFPIAAYLIISVCGFFWWRKDVYNFRQMEGARRDQRLGVTSEEDDD